MPRRTHLVLAIALFAMVAAPLVVQADHSWGNYHWERSGNLSLDLGDNVDPAKWGARLTEASGDWSSSNVLDTTVVAGGTRPKNCRPTAGRAEVCSERYGNNGWLGIAQIWASGDHITQGIVKVNDYYHDSPPYDSYSWKQAVMCQEIGHIFGLDHQNEDFGTDETTSCMEYTSDPQGNESPDSHDFQQLSSIYGHDDGDGGGGGGPGDGCWPPGKCKNGQQGPPPAFGMPLPAIEQWGRLISTSRDGGQSLFVQDFGNGYRVYTHVTWTLEVAERLRRDH